MNKTVIFFLLFLVSKLTFAATPQYYCTAADSNFFPLLLNLIGSIHRSNYEMLEEIAVYDLGLTEKEKKILSKVSKVNVYTVEKTNHKIFTPILTAPNGRKVRGAFSWKPVVIKQALEKFPYVLYLDAGVCVMSNIEDIFYWIKTNQCFFLNVGHNIVDRITVYPIENIIDKQFSSLKDFLLDKNTSEIAANVQGISRSMLADYVLPMYEYSKDFKLFDDDGTAPLGWGAARHDQNLFSILVHVNKYKLFDQGQISLKYSDGVEKTICCDWIFRSSSMHIWLNQGGRHFEGGFSRFIKKNKQPPKRRNSSEKSIQL